MTEPPTASTLRRTSWGVIDQMVWSLGNVVLTIIIARSVSDSDFGRFSSIFGVVLVVVGTTGAYLYEPLVMSDAKRRARSQPALLRVAALSGFGFGALMVLSSRLFLGSSEALIGLGLALPVLAVMEVLRGTLNYVGRTRLLCALDILWTVLSAVLLLIAGQTSAGPGLLGLIWALAALPSVFIGIWATRRTDALPVHSALEPARGYGISFAAEFVVSSGVAQMVPLIVAVAATFEAAGELRLVQVAFGPVTALFAGIRVVAMPQMRDHRERGRSVIGPMWALIGMLTFVAVAYGGVLYVLGDDLLADVFGSTWLAAAALLPAAIAIRVCNALSLGAILVARVSERTTASRRVRIMVGMVMVSGAATGALTADAQGAIIGLLGAQAVGVVAWFIVIRPELRNPIGVRPC